MRKFKADTWIFIGLSICLIMIGFLSSSQGNNGEIEKFPRRTTYSARPGGLKALYETLHQSGFKVSRKNTSLTEAPEKGVCFVIAPELPVTPEEWKTLQEWVSQGNLLILGGREPVFSDPFTHETKSKRSQPIMPSFLSPGVQSIRVAELSRFDNEEAGFSEIDDFAKRLPKFPGLKKLTQQSDAPEPKQPRILLFADSKGATVAASHWGKGTVVYLAGGWQLSNQGINQGDNLRFVLNAIQSQSKDTASSITFDEYHHGYQEGKGILSLIKTPARLGLAQIAMGFLLLLISVSKRFGRMISLQEEARQRGEYLSSMAALLKHAKATDLVQKELGERFLSEFAGSMGLPPASDLQTILETASVRYPEKAKELEELCHAAVSMKANTSEAALLALAKKWHKMRKELIR